MKGAAAEFETHLSVEKIFRSKRRNLFLPLYPLSLSKFRRIKPMTPFTQYRHMVYYSSYLVGRRDP
jgi:hypothetical protein